MQYQCVAMDNICILDHIYVCLNISTTLYIPLKCLNRFELLDKYKNECNYVQMSNRLICLSVC